MNSLNDPSKKTSINSLLNPQDASVAFPAQPPHLTASLAPNPGHPHNQQGVPVYAPYSANASFNLRAASWDMSEDAAKRKPENGATAQRHYHHPSMNSAEAYTEHPGTRLVRPRLDESNNYPIDNQVWPAQPDIANMPYGAPVMAPMYSDERTGKLDMCIRFFIAYRLIILL